MGRLSASYSIHHRREWAIFENANICNPSILDRLNLLLEECKYVKVIKEQGLNDSTQTLRTVKVHKSFRPIFVLFKKSLVEQRRDFSHALRNRCVQLSLTFVDALQELCHLADKKGLAVVKLTLQADKFVQFKSL